MPLDQNTTQKISSAMVSDFDTVDEFLDSYLCDITLLAGTLISAAAANDVVPAADVMVIADLIQQKAKAAQAALNP